MTFDCQPTCVLRHRGRVARLISVFAAKAKNYAWAPLEETMDRKMSIRCGGGCGGSGRGRDGGAAAAAVEVAKRDLYEDGPVGNATRLLLPSLFYDSENDCDNTPWMRVAQGKVGRYKGLVRVQPPHYYPHPHLPLPFHRIIHLASRPNNRAPR